MHDTLRSEKTKLLLLALSLAALDIWGDMKGASALFVQINSIVGSALINGRMIGLTGIAICSAIAALKPSIVLFSRSSLSVVPSLAAICSALFFFAPSISENPAVGSVLTILVAGFCYGWFEVMILGRVCTSFSNVRKPLFVIALSIALKTVLLPCACCLPDIAQLIAFVALPLFMGLCLFAIYEPKDASLSAQGPVLTAQGISQYASSTIFIVLVLLSLLSATARSIGVFAFWGESGLIGTDDLGPAAIAAPIFGLIAYAAFAKTPERSIMALIIKLLVVLLAGFLLAASDIWKYSFIPSYLGSSLEVFLDAFAFFLSRIAVLTTARTSNMSAYAIAGAAEAVSCIASILFGIALSFSPDAQVFLTLFTTFAVAAASLFALEKTLVREPNSDSFSIGDRCEAIAEEYNLTPREKDVLELLLKGRSQTFIAEELVLAPSTIKTHIKHIYQKVGVSDKQELISTAYNTQRKQQDDQRK